MYASQRDFQSSSQGIGYRCDKVTTMDLLSEVIKNIYGLHCTQYLDWQARCSEKPVSRINEWPCSKTNGLNT